MNDENGSKKRLIIFGSWIRLLIFSLILMFVFVISALIIIVSLQRDLDEEIVPAFVGLDVSEASQRLLALNSRIERKIQEKFSFRIIPVFDDNFPKFTVVKQLPEAGMKIREGRVIELTVSNGPATSVMPNFVGQNFIDVRAALIDRIFNFSEVFHLSSSVITKDIHRIISNKSVSIDEKFKKIDRLEKFRDSILKTSSEKELKTILNRDKKKLADSFSYAMITKLFSERDEMQTYDMLINDFNDLLNKKADDNIQFVLLDNVTFEYSNNHKRGTIIKQSPEAGVKLSKDVHLDVHVSLGNRSIKTEDYKGKYYINIVEKLNEQSINVILENSNTEKSELNGTIKSQSVEAGKELIIGDTITLVVYNYNKLQDLESAYQYLKLTIPDNIARYKYSDKAKKMKIPLKVSSSNVLGEKPIDRKRLTIIVKDKYSIRTIYDGYLKSGTTKITGYKLYSSGYLLLYIDENLYNIIEKTL